ncbi:hypothetical protein LXL04_013350 [Taraxacum kok-saghyz]
MPFRRAFSAKSSFLCEMDGYFMNAIWWKTFVESGYFGQKLLKIIVSQLNLAWNGKLEIRQTYESKCGFDHYDSISTSLIAPIIRESQKGLLKYPTQIQMLKLQKRAFDTLGGRNNSGAAIGEDLRACIAIKNGDKCREEKSPHDTDFADNKIYNQYIHFMKDWNGIMIFILIIHAMFVSIKVNIIFHHVVSDRVPTVRNFDVKEIDLRPVSKFH